MYPRRLSFLQGPVNFTLRYSPTQAVMRRNTRDRLAVLAYHQITDPEAFAVQLAYLARHAHPVSLEELTVASRTGASLPPRSVLLTFDDGDISVLDEALPLLRERGIPAVAFVCPSVLGTDRPLWFDELRGLVDAGARLPEWVGKRVEDAEVLLVTLPCADRYRFLSGLQTTLPPGTGPIRRRQMCSEDLPRLEHDGVAIGNHTMTHPSLTCCDRETIAWEIGEAHRRLTEILGHGPTAFSYPNDEWDGRVVEELAAVGYEIAFTYDHALSASPPTTLIRVSRLRGEASDSIDRLAISLSGLHPAVWHAADRVRRRGRPAPSRMLHGSKPRYRSERPVTEPSRVEYRPFTRDDEDQIVDLLGVAMYGADFPDLRGYWRWKHYDCPFGESFGLVAVDQEKAAGKVVGLRVFMRWELLGHGRVYRAGRAVDTATHPDWRRRGFFEHMTIALTERLTAEGFDLTFNTPNQFSLPGYLKMGWEEVGRLPLRVKVRRPARVLGATARAALRRGDLSTPADFSGVVDNGEVLELLRDPTVRSFIDRVADGDRVAWAGRRAGGRMGGGPAGGGAPAGAPTGGAAPGGGGLHTVPTSEYLEWHYGLNRWYGYSAAFDSRGDSAALVIGRPRRRGALNELLITEVVCLPDAGGGRIAARVAGQLAKKTDADYLGVSALSGPLNLSRGYFPAGPRGTNVTVCALQPLLPVDPARYSSWSASMGDLELF